MTDPLERFSWNVFLDVLSLWEKMYEAYSKLAQKSPVFLIGMKQAVIVQRKSVYEIYGEKEQKYFEEIQAKLTQQFDPDFHLEKLTNNLLCVKFLPESHLSERYGLDEICGKFLGLAQNVTTKIKSGETGEYEIKESDISFRLGYPTSEDVIEVSSLDLAGLDVFIL